MTAIEEWFDGDGDEPFPGDWVPSFGHDLDDKSWPKSPRFQTLTESLEELERTDPAVAQAAANYDRMAFRFRLRRRLRERAEREGTPS